MALAGPVGPFTEIGNRFNFLSEQFWGRAARASNDSRESDARFILQCSLNPLVPLEKTPLPVLTLSSVRRNSEIYCDASLSFHRLSALVVRFEMPLFYGLTRRLGKYRRSAENLYALNVPIATD